MQHWVNWRNIVALVCLALVTIMGPPLHPGATGREGWSVDKWTEESDWSVDALDEGVGRRGAFLSTSGSFTLSSGGGGRSGNSEELEEFE